MSIRTSFTLNSVAKTIIPIIQIYIRRLIRYWFVFSQCWPPMAFVTEQPSSRLKLNRMANSRSRLRMQTRISRQLTSIHKHRKARSEPGSDATASAAAALKAAL